ncbi:MAG: SH3 domain-containing protein [Ardenticatenaceae bacterium]|nr:SH3 domain-containing protein [Anaerolineales bacterium]MCB8921050.1 SH3 domain-containing protein [Ardenticatenaceae bacterium]MCB8991186.1 SH3 domain-containing protein [Ardenticatenaceae bacterium]MCB9005743.1 SH3 domain-containing protein [Ardenticatenaceae bacterium]
MNGIFIPVVLAIVGLVTAAATYRGIRRGGARLYTLEREAMLRRANFTLVGTVLLFSAAIGLLLMERQQLTTTLDEPEQAVEEGLVSSPTPAIEQFPPTTTPSPTPDPDEPTPTATPVVCRASIEDTGGSGLLLRSTPGGEELSILPEGTLLTLLADDPVELNGFIWRKVRVIGGEEGWVAEDYLAIGAPCE